MNNHGINKLKREVWRLVHEERERTERGVERLLEKLLTTQNQDKQDSTLEIDLEEIEKRMKRELKELHLNYPEDRLCIYKHHFTELYKLVEKFCRKQKPQPKYSIYMMKDGRATIVNDEIGRLEGEVFGVTSLEDAKKKVSQWLKEFRNEH